jgi:hypothetical protein
MSNLGSNADTTLMSCLASTVVVFNIAKFAAHPDMHARSRRLEVKLRNNRQV